MIFEIKDGNYSFRSKRSWYNPKIKVPYIGPRSIVHLADKVWTDYVCKAVFQLALIVGVPRWEEEGSKWNNAIMGISGTHEEMGQVGNNQWPVGNNQIWRRCFSQFPLVDITFIYNVWLFLVQILIIMMEQQVNFYFQSILSIFIFYSTEGQKAGRFFLF